jgi:hypothetical protein
MSISIKFSEIEVIIPRPAIVFASEALDRIEVVPECQVNEMRHISFGPVQHMLVRRHGVERKALAVGENGISA